MLKAQIWCTALADKAATGMDAVRPRKGDGQRDGPAPVSSLEDRIASPDGDRLDLGRERLEGVPDGAIADEAGATGSWPEVS